MVNHDRNRSELARTNRRSVLAEVAIRGPLSRTDIANSIGLTAASVSRITRELIEADLLRELPNDDDRQLTLPRSPGRRFIQLEVNASGGYVLGVGVNVFSQAVTLADLRNRRIVRQDLKLRDLSDPEWVIDQVVREAKKMMSIHVADRRRILGATFAFAGAVDPSTGVVQTSPYLRWGEVSLREKFVHELNIPIRLESLPASMAVAEFRFGAARGMADLLVVNCSLGLGAALLSDGRLVRGQNFSAGLIGDVTPGGVPGETLDALAGGHGVLKRLFGARLNIAMTPSNELADMLMEAVGRCQKGDPDAVGAFHDAGESLGRFLAPILGLLRPKGLMVAGPLTQAPSFVLAYKNCLREIAKDYECKIMVSDLSPQAAARWLAIDEFLLGRDLNLNDLKLSRAA